jgi:uncharacterized protein (DUF433 family)
VEVCRAGYTQGTIFTITKDEIIAEFPNLKTMQIQACLDYARELAEFEEVA